MTNTKTATKTDNAATRAQLVTLDDDATAAERTFAQRVNAEKTRTAIADLVGRGALVVCSHSGGKDSQRLYMWCRENVPADQLIVVHADLGAAEQTGTLDHVIANVDTDAHELLVAQAVDMKGATKWFLDMVLMRFEKMSNTIDKRTGELQIVSAGCWPIIGKCQGTSDLKRGPVAKVIRHWLKAHPNHSGLVVECLGRRADESERRASKTVDCFKYESAGHQAAGREWYKADPIADMTTDQVIADIVASDDQELHATYTEHGFERMSCVVCIHGSRDDMLTAATVRPHLFAKYVAVELFTGKTLRMNETLEQYAGITADAELVELYLDEIRNTGRVSQSEPVVTKTASRVSLNVLAS